jgi:hypothetical protein
MRAILQIVVGLIPAMLAGALQAESVALNSFSTEAGAAISSLSSATASGFTRTYTNAPADSRVINTAALASPRTIAEGESAVFTFTFDSTQIKDSGASTSAFRWGFDFGAQVVAVLVDVGTPLYTFKQDRFDSSAGYPFTVGTLAGSWETTTGGPVPASTAYLNADHVVTIVTTLKRVSGNNYEVKVQWGGQTYISSAAFTADHTLDTVFIASGASSGTVNDIGDNYTISNVSLEVGPETARASLFIVR